MREQTSIPLAGEFGCLNHLARGEINNQLPAVYEDHAIRCDLVKTVKIFPDNVQ